MIFGFLILAGFILLSSFVFVRFNNQYVESVIMCLGKFHSVQKSGFYIVIPFLRTIEKAVDTRLKTSTLTSEKALTSNGIPLDITLFFQWQVFDAPKAVLEIEDYEEAIFSIAHTTMRERIGEMTTNDLLVERNEFSAKLQRDLEEKTAEWGITIKRIEVQDIMLPAEIQTLMSQQERATREAQANLTLANNAREVAEINAQTSKIYEKDAKAWEIRRLDALIEIASKGRALIVPSDLASSVSSTNAAITAETQSMLEDK